MLQTTPENDPDVLSMIGSSAALHLSQIPFLKVTGTVRVGRIGNELILMPSHSQLEESDLDLVVSGTKEGITRTRGRWFKFHTGRREIRALATYHPAFLLRSPLQKRLAWRDFLALKKALAN